MKSYRFTLAVLLAVALAMAAPEWFREIGGFPLRKLIVPLLQVIMLGMGVTMSWQDFSGVLRMPKAVGIGLVCQFTIMPLGGAALAYGFGFPPEIAAGIILVGCSPSGLASNVMAYIAGAHVALSITITAFATLLAPLLTPLLMQLLAGQLIGISVPAMMLDIFQMIILPIALGLLIHHTLPGLVRRVGALLPAVSMAGIALIIAIITASGREAMLRIGPLLLLAVVLHNVLGYLLGYGSARLLGMAERDARTVAIEVGLQNAGLASGLAVQMGKEATVGLAAALFGPVMNTTGSLLASWWGRRAPQASESAPAG
ncbi:MAG: bile acid:sodium symporter family protein [Bacteroidia bacterium]|nr:bile acid:sodium symporter family protein [Bacteroidia bacterium]